MWMEKILIDREALFVSEFLNFLQLLSYSTYGIAALIDVWIIEVSQVVIHVAALQ